VPSDSFSHDDVGTRSAQRLRPSGRVLMEERFQCAGDEDVRGREPGIVSGGRYPAPGEAQKTAP
jgi:hypothetical protein